MPMPSNPPSLPTHSQTRPIRYPVHLRLIPSPMTKITRQAKSTLEKTTNFVIDFGVIWASKMFPKWPPNRPK